MATAEKSNATKMEARVACTVRSHARVEDKTRQIASPNDVRLTITLMQVEAVNVEPTRDFFDMCREWQRNLNAACQPSAMRASAVGASAMLNSLNASRLPRRGLIAEVFDPVNLGRFDFPTQHQHVRIDSLHFGQSYLPYISLLCGLLWPCETAGRITWSMERWPSLATEAQAQAQVDLWDKTIQQAENGLLTTPHDFLTQLRQTGDLSKLLVALNK